MTAAEPAPEPMTPEDMGKAACRAEVLQDDAVLRKVAQIVAADMRQREAAADDDAA